MLPKQWIGAFILGLAVLQAPAAIAFDAQGHRGARGLLPENTLAAFAGALAIGVDTLELDLGVTRDGVVVVTHNPLLDPATTRDKSGRWLAREDLAVHAMTLEQLRTYDVGRIKPGSRYSERFPDQKAIDGTRIPTLAEVIDLVKRSGNERVRFNIETKIRPEQPDLTPPPARYVEALLKVLREKDILDRVTLQSFDWRTLKEVQRRAPGVPTAYLTVRQSWFDNIRPGEAGPSPWTAGLDVDDFAGDLPTAVHAAGGHIWSSYHREVTPASIARAHGLGLQVTVWTVNSPARMEAFIAMGVDGIITDYPDRLRHVLEKLGMPSPDPTPVSP